MAATFIPNNAQVPEVSQTTSFAATAGLFYVVSGSAAITATLPTAVGNSGMVVRVRCANGYAGLCTIATTSSQTLGPGSATSQVIYAGEAVLVQSDGSNWVRTGGLLIPCDCKMSLNANQTIAYNTETQVTLNVADFDTTQQMANTATHTITVIRPGHYRLIGSAFWGAIGTEGWNYYTLINRNVSTQTIYYQTAYGASGVANYTQTVLAFGTVSLVAGDTLQLRVYQQGSTGSGTAALLGSTSGVAITSMEVQELLTW